MKIFILLIFISLFTLKVHSQTEQRLKTTISGNGAMTNNGISFVPNFSLEQPAAIINLILEKGRFSFEPELTFSLEEGRAWYQVYWLRYNFLAKGKFQLQTSGHCGFNFARILDASNNEAIKTERYLVAELVPSYELSKHIKVSTQYMLAQGYDIGTSNLQHYFSLNGNFSNINLSKMLALNVSTQMYYLSTFGSEEGIYTATSFNLRRTNSPVSLSALLNKALSTEIDGKDFLWNLTLSYSFGDGVLSKH